MVTESEESEWVPLPRPGTRLWWLWWMMALVLHLAVAWGIPLGMALAFRYGLLSAVAVENALLAILSALGICQIAAVALALTGWFHRTTLRMREDWLDNQAALEAMADMGPTRTWEEYLEERGLTIVVNARRQHAWGDELSFGDLTAFTFPALLAIAVYTVTYRNGPAENPQGQLFEGQSVKLRDGMVFDVTASTPGEPWPGASR